MKYRFIFDKKLGTFKRVGCVAALAVANLFALPNASASIANRAEEDGDAELVLVVWDPVKEFSYALDLGIRGSEIFNAGQSDAGYQKFISVDPSLDNKFKLLRDQGTATSSLRWAVMSFGYSGLGNEPGDQNIYITAEATVQNGVNAAAYSNLLQLGNENLIQAGLSMTVGLPEALNYDQSNPNNTHTLGVELDFAHNGSSLSKVGELGYFGMEVMPFFYSANASLTNPVGKSSWFYALDLSSQDAYETIVVDEFDNLGGDAYWGLVEDTTTGKFVLSYTLAPALPQNQVVTPQGMLRASSTEFQAGLTTNVTTGPQAEFAEYVAMSFAPVSAVPEPSTYALFGVGLLGVWLKRRRKD